MFKPKNYRDVQNLYEGKTGMDRIPNDFDLLNSTCWKERYQTLTNDVTKDENTGRYRLGLNF